MRVGMSGLYRQMVKQVRQRAFRHFGQKDTWPIPSQTRRRNKSAQTWSATMAAWFGISRALYMLRCTEISQPVSLTGQNLRLPQCNIGIRFTPISRHYGRPDCILAAVGL
jgi:hypothetical protein